MNILLAYRGLPWPITEGYHLRILHIFKHLKAAGHEVHLLALCNNLDQRKCLTDLQKHNLFTSIHCLDFPPRNLLGRIKTNLGMNGANSLLAEYPGFGQQVKAKVVELREHHQLDVAYIFDPWVEVLFAEASREIPSLLDICDSRTLFYERQLASKKFFELSALRIQQLVRRFRDIESFSLANYSLATVVSPDDQNALRKMNPTAEVEVIANGVDTEQFAPIETNPPQAGRMLIFGNMDFLPNVDSAIRSATELLPKIRQQVPAAHLIVVGTNPLPEVRALNNLPGVEVTGEVPDLTPIINSSQFLLAPMRFGAGIKNKILETMACGRAVITSPDTASALHPDAANLLVQAATNKELVAAAVQLLKDQKKSAQLGKAGREVMRRHHSWGAAAARYAELLSELTECR